MCLLIFITLSVTTLRGLQKESYRNIKSAKNLPPIDKPKIKREKGGGGGGAGVCGVKKGLSRTINANPEKSSPLSRICLKEL